MDFQKSGGFAGGPPDGDSQTGGVPRTELSDDTLPNVFGHVDHHIHRHVGGGTLACISHGRLWGTTWRRHSCLPRPHSWGRSWFDAVSHPQSVSRRFWIWPASQGGG